MPFPEFDSFRAELQALRNALNGFQGKILREESLRERFRTLFRSWVSNVQPTISGYVQNSRDLLKLNAEVEKIAQLTTKLKKVAEYRSRLRRAAELASVLVLSLPADRMPLTQRQELFLPEIPDLPISMVPDPLVGRQSQIRQFLHKHPFDRSVFIMIRYRSRNKDLIGRIKAAVAGCSIERRPFYPVLASDHKLTDDLYNPIACLLCCSLGIAVFDKGEPAETYNPNVAYELGMMHLLNRKCLLLKHETLRSLQTDILMKLYESYSGPVSAGTLVRAWPPLLPATE